jgi:CheY-like chemotaxis protein
MKVLLVEDVAFNSLLAKKMLTNWNAEVTIAENGLLAVEKVRNNKYDLILMDVQMPVMDGLTASREIRKFNDVVPIFPLTASTSAEMQAKFLKIGIKEFIFKPINPDTLHRTLLKQAGRLA